MALKKEALEREFILKRNGNETVLADPDPSMTPEQVMTFYTNTYPELVTSNVHGPVYRDKKTVYTFKNSVVTKG